MATFQSFDTEFVQHITCLALPNEFYTSTNPTFIDVYGNNVTNSDYVRITEVGLYNAAGILIAIAKTSEPVYKNRAGVVSFDITLKV